MTRLLIVLLTLLGVLAGADYLLSRNQESRRLQDSTLRPLSRLRVEQIGELRIESGRNTWIYVRRDGIWYYPDYFNAFAQGDRVERLLGGLLQSLATVVRAKPGNMRRYGLTPERSLKLHLEDGGGNQLLQVWIGRGLPGPAAGEAYVKLAATDTVYHLHANPRLALDKGRPPMVDPFVLPRALERGPVAKVTFERQDPYPLRHLRRLRTPATSPSQSGFPPPRPAFEWRAGLAAGEQACVRSSVFAYLSYLSRLRYEELHDPRAGANFSNAPDRLILKDARGRVDTIEVGGQDAIGNTLIRHRTTGNILSIAPPKSALLFPASEAFLETLSMPDPYQLAEPLGL